MKEFKPEQVISGTWGELWYDGEYMAEIVGGKAEITYKKTGIQQACRMMEGQKITGLEAKGEFKIYHINSTVMKKELEAVNKGKTATHTIIMKLADPDALGAEKIAFYNCVLDKVILMDFESGKMGERTYGFTFDRWELLESINMAN